MARATLQQVLEQINTLNRDELQQVSRVVQARLASQEELRKRQAFHQALLASGLVRHIKSPPPVDVLERRLVQAQGKPVSETIIEERR